MSNYDEMSAILKNMDTIAKAFDLFESKRKAFLDKLPIYRERYNV